MKKVSPELLALFDDLIILMSTIYEKNIKGLAKEATDYEQIVLDKFSKQFISHLKSIQLLFQTDSTLDTKIIARNILEGVVVFVYIFKKKYFKNWCCFFIQKQVHLVVQLKLVIYEIIIKLF